MSVKRIRQGAGLYTDPSTLDVPEGAMLQADNVVLHRRGSIQPRPGIGDTTGIAARSTTYRPIKLVPFDGDIVVQSRDGSDYRLERASVDTQYAATADATPPDLTLRGSSAFASMRDSLYYTTSTGVRKLEGAAVTASEPAGVVTDYYTVLLFPLTASADTQSLEPSSIVAWRYCWVREDGNGYVRRSAPSPRIGAPNNDPSEAFNFTVDRLYLPDGIGAGDRFELYRTRNTSPETSDPGDELFFVTSYEVTAADVSLGYVPRGTIFDFTPDDELGVALYTNASQGGVLNANERPPASVALAEWDGRMWYGNTTERAALVVEPTTIFVLAREETWLSGIHTSSKTVTFTSGSATATLTTVAGLKVGQRINITGADYNETAPSPDDYIPGGTTITAIRTKFTIANHANIRTSPTPADYLEFKGFRTLGRDRQRWTWNASDLGNFSTGVGADAGEAADNLANDINAVSAAGVLHGGTWTATSDNVDTVTIESDEGHGVEIFISEDTAGTFTVAYEIDLSEDALRTGSELMDIGDVITVNGVEFYMRDSATTMGTGELIPTSGGLDARNISVENVITGSETHLGLLRSLASNIARSVTSQSVRGTSGLRVRGIAPTFGQSYTGAPNATDPLGNSDVTLIAEDPSVGPITFSAPVRPAGWRLNGASTITSSAHQHPGRVAFSKPDEPEAVPPLYYVDVGNPNEPVIALTPMADALLVWKADGLHRITGTAPNLSVHALDEDVRLLAPDTITILDEVCYAWTTSGLVGATENGLIRGQGGAPVDFAAPIANELRTHRLLLPKDVSAHRRGFYTVAHDRLGLLALAVADAADDDASAEWWVWHQSANAWARWTRTDRCAVYDPTTDRMLVSTSHDSWNIYGERTDENDGDSYVDEATGFISASTSGDVITVAKADVPWTPTICDAIQGDQEVIGDPKVRITAVTDAGTDWEITAAGVQALTTAKLHRGWQVNLQWQAQHMASLGCRWSEIHAEFLDNVDGTNATTMTVNVGGAAHRDSAVSTVAATVPTNVTYTDPVRVGPPRALVRTPHLFPYIGICAAAVRWRLSHLYLHHTTNRQRVAR